MLNALSTSDRRCRIYRDFDNFIQGNYKLKAPIQSKLSMRGSDYIAAAVISEPLP